ncbi:TIGR04338 family metallohydrolase [Mycolicibacterium pulveris]|uniref:TIGR04338 family metallohydrolase n=1 Tax=Mycolicibacterium pulveris TaxID=36813 RepID=UPI003CF9F188
MSARDFQRAKVYAAEEFVRTLFDRAGERANPVVEFFGTQLTLPPEGRFASVPAVQRYIDEVLAMPGVQRRWPGAPPLRVRARRGVAAAHYERSADAAVIAVPEQRGSGWALRELVVLHEIAHHLCDDPPPHGPQFVATFCELTEAVMGPEVAHVLRVVFAKEGVR